MVRARCDLPDSSQPVVEEEPMSGPSFTRSDLCSILAAVGIAESVGAVRSLLSANAFPLIDDDPLAPLAGVLHASGYLDRRGTGGTCPVTRCRGQRTGVGR